MYSPVKIREFIRDNLLLVLILIISVILSCYKLNDCQMTVDEFYSINIAQRSLAEIWSFKPHPGTFYFNRFPPLHETVLHFVWNISNESLLWARLLSVLFNTAALFLIFLISKILFDKKTALISVSLAAFNYAYIFFPKMVRCYSLLNFLGLASFYIFFRIAKSQIVDNKRLVFLLLINTAILYTFYFGGFVILLELILSCFFLTKRDLVKFWLGLLSSFVLFLPWLGHLLEDLSKEMAFHFKISSMRVFLDVLFSRLQVGIFWNTGLLIFYFAICIYFILNSVYLFLKKDKKAPLVISLLVILLPTIFIISYLTSESGKDSSIYPLLNDPERARYFFSFIFPVFILTGFFISKLTRYIGGVIFLVIFSYSAYVVSIYFRASPLDFWWVQLAPITIEAKNFHVPDTDKVLVDIEDSFFVPVFVYYFYGPQYFRNVSIPYGGANLKQLNMTVKTNYKVVFNVAGFKRFNSFDSVAHLNDFDWFFLIYSDWLEPAWGKPYRKIYEGRLIERGMQDKVILVQKKLVGSFILEIYKIKK